MKVSSVSYSLLLLLFIVFLMAATSLGFNAVTLPWLALMAASISVAVVFALFGRYLLPPILKRLGVKIYIGDMKIYDKYVIVEGVDSTAARYVGFSVVKLIPTTPAMDMAEKERESLLRSMENLVRQFPVDAEFGVRIGVDPDIQRLLKAIQSEKQKYIARKAATTNPGAHTRYDLKIQQLMKEEERLLKSPPISGFIYVKVIAHGYTEEEVVAELDKAISRVAAAAASINAIPQVLTSLDLYDFIEAQLVPKAASAVR